MANEEAQVQYNDTGPKLCTQEAPGGKALKLGIAWPIQINVVGANHKFADMWHNLPDSTRDRSILVKSIEPFRSSADVARRIQTAFNSRCFMERSHPLAAQKIRPSVYRLCENRSHTASPITVRYAGMLWVALQAQRTRLFLISSTSSLKSKKRIMGRCTAGGVGYTS